MTNFIKSKTFKILIAATILTLGFWAFYFYWLNEIGKISDSLIEINKKVVFASKKEIAIKQLREKIVATSNNGLDLRTFIIKGDEATELVQTLESFGPKTKTEITIDSVGTEPAVGLPDGAEFLRLGLGIKGSKNDVVNATRLIESLPYNMKIRNFSLSRTGGPVSATSTVQNSVWQAKMDLNLVKLAEIASSGTPNPGQ